VLVPQTAMRFMVRDNGDTLESSTDSRGAISQLDYEESRR
jgi:hypothetical protein